MSAISLKSITGITSITTPAGADNQLTLHTNNTNESVKLDHAGNLHFSNHVNTTGITSASNFKTGSSNLHSTGLTVGDTFVHSTGVNASSLDVDDFVDVGNNIKLGNAGVITATSFVGDGSDLTNLPAGLGTALSSTQTNPLNKMYYTNQVLGIGATVTVDPPASAQAAYTQYADIKVDDDYDLIIAEGDDLIPDVLGLADFGNFGGGPSAGRIRVNSITNSAANGAPTVQNGLVISGIMTAQKSGVFGNTSDSFTALTITSSTSGISELRFADTTVNAGYVKYQHSNNVLILATNTSERLRIDSSGRVQIASTNNSATGTRLVVGNGNNMAATVLINTQDTDVNALTLSNWDGATTSNKVIVGFDNSGRGSFAMGMPASTNAFAFFSSIDGASNERLRITSTGEVNIGGNYTQTTAPLCVTTSANDYGIRLQTGSNVVCEILNNDSAGNSEIRGYYNNNSGTRGEGYRLEANGRTFFNPGGNGGLSIKSDGKASLGNTGGSGTGALTIYPNSITGMGRLDVYGGGDENSQTQARNEVMRIGRGDILDGYYHSIWSATGSGSANSHFLKFYVSNGTGGGSTTQKEALSMNGEGHVTKVSQPRALVKISSTTTISDGKVTNWASPTYNVGSLWDASNNRFVAPTDGLYLIGGNFRIGAPGKVRVTRFSIRAYNTSNVQMAGYGGGVGGGNNYDGGSSGYDHPYVSFTNAIYLTTGQYLELWLQEVGTEYTSYIQVSNEQSHMWCVLLQ